MNYYVGVDIVNIKRFISLKDSIKLKLFSNDEINYCNSKNKPERYFAGRFAAKESIIKAFNKLDLKMNFKDISIVCKPNSYPYVIIDKYPKIEVDLSISHDGDYAIAYCIVREKND